MNDDTQTEIKGRASDAKPSSRDSQRAEALRANLMRRKAQARGRTEATEAQPTNPLGSKSPGPKSAADA
jgi:hypothetical protein